MLDLLLIDGDGTATSLSEQLPVTRQAVAKHLGVLDRVGLVHATPAGASGATAWTRPSSPAPSPSCRRSARRGTPDCSGSSASPRRSSARQEHRRPTPPDERERRSKWWTSCTGSASRRVAGEGVRRADHRRRPGRLVDRRHDGRQRRRRRDRVPLPARRLRHGGRSSSSPAGGCAGRSSTDPRSGSAPRSTGTSARTATTRSCCSSTRAGRSRSSSCTTAAPSGRTYLMSLKQLVETGEGAPAPRDVQISDWH